MAVYPVFGDDSFGNDSFQKLIQYKQIDEQPKKSATYQEETNEQF